MLVMTRPLKETLENEAYEHAAQSNRTQVGTDRRGRDALAGDVPEDLVRRVEDPAQHASPASSSLAHEGPAWLEGALGARPRARDLDLARRAAAVPADDAARPALPAPAARRPRTRPTSPRWSTCSRPRPTRRWRVAPHARRRAGALDRVELDRLAVAAARAAALAAGRRRAQPCLPSSILAIALRCTSSGPSAKRSVRAPA